MAVSYKNGHVEDMGMAPLAPLAAPLNLELSARADHQKETFKFSSQLILVKRPCLQSYQNDSNLT